MYLNEAMKIHIQNHEDQIAGLKEKIAMLPEGILQLSMSGRYCTWRVLYPDGSRSYLPKDNIELASALARKILYESQVEDLEKEISACKAYLKSAGKTSSLEERLMKKSGEELKRLMCIENENINERIKQWENEPYKKLDKFPEALKYPTLKPDEKVRSKFEADVARDVYILEIPYKYEKIIRVGDVNVAPDFILLDTRTFREIPLELFGMMDNPDYRKNHDKKLANYILNGFYPGVNMLTFYESEITPANPAYIKQVLREFFFVNPPVIF